MLKITGARKFLCFNQLYFMCMLLTDLFYKLHTVCIISYLIFNLTYLSGELLIFIVFDPLNVELPHSARLAFCLNQRVQTQARATCPSPLINFAYCNSLHEQIVCSILLRMSPIWSLLILLQSHLFDIYD